MLRPVLVAGGTIAGLIALFTYRTHVPGTALVAASSSPAALAATAPPRASASPSASVTTSKKAAPAPSRTTASAATTPTSSAKPAPTQTPTATATPTQTKAASGTFEGSSVNTQYGPVQVAITVTGGKITNAGDTQQTADSIGYNAVQQLNQEVLTAQSANIQAVSGATFTSDGYIQSLQQAVDQAGL
jgi:uncharacterized protein with FMN-binding domain